MAVHAAWVLQVMEAADLGPSARCPVYAMLSNHTRGTVFNLEVLTRAEQDTGLSPGE